MGPMGAPGDDPENSDPDNYDNRAEDWVEDRTDFPQYPPSFFERARTAVGQLFRRRSDPESIANV